MTNFNESEGFDDLLEDVTPDDTPPVNTEEVTVETDINEDLVDDTPKEDDQVTEEPSNDFIDSFLREYGIENKVITYENDNGETEEVKFDELDDSEKLAILKNLTSPNLTEDEVNTINYLRSNNATIQDVIEFYKQQAVEEYIKSHGENNKTYSIDEYTDDELYMADLKTKFKDMSDEDIEADLEVAKANEDLFKKKVTAIRNQYKAKEDEELKAAQKAQEDQYNNFKSSIEDALNNFSEISLDYKDSKSDRFGIADSEKDEVYRYILQQDEKGMTQLYKDLNDPKKLVKLAWLSKYADDFISDVSNYWKKQLKTTRRAESKAQTTIVKPNTQKQEMNKKIDVFQNRNIVNIDADFDDLF